MRLKLLLPYKSLIVQTNAQFIPMKRHKSDRKPERLEKENPYNDLSNVASIWPDLSIGL